MKEMPREFPSNDSKTSLELNEQTSCSNISQANKKKQVGKKVKKSSPRANNLMIKHVSLPPADNLINIAFDKNAVLKKVPIVNSNESKANKKEDSKQKENIVKKQEESTASVVNEVESNHEKEVEKAESVNISVNNFFNGEKDDIFASPIDNQYDLTPQYEPDEPTKKKDESLDKVKEESSRPEENMKIKLPNTFNCDNVLLTRTSGVVAKKINKIIEDDDETEGNIEANQNHTEIVGTKIKISLDSRDFRSPIKSITRSDYSDHNLKLDTKPESSEDKQKSLKDKKANADFLSQSVPLKNKPDTFSQSGQIKVKSNLILSKINDGLNNEIKKKDTSICFIMDISEMIEKMNKKLCDILKSKMPSNNIL